MSILSSLRKFAPKGAKAQTDTVGKPDALGSRPFFHVIAIPSSTADNAAGITSTQLKGILDDAAAGEAQDQARLISYMCEKDALLGGLFDTRKEAATSSNWHLFERRDLRFTQEQSDSTKEFEEHLRSIGIDHALNHLFDFIKFGYQGMVIEWGPGGVLEGFKPIDPTVWTFDDAGFPAYEPADGGEPVPISKFHQHQFVFLKYGHPYGNPARSGIGRACAWDWYQKHRTAGAWMRYNEKFGQPFIVLRMSSADYEDKDRRDELMSKARKAAADGVFVTKGVSDNSDVNLLQGQDNQVHERKIKQTNREMTIRVLGQLGSSEGEPGRLGNQEAQRDVRSSMREHDCRLLMAYVQSQIIKPAWFYLHGEKEQPPFFAMNYADPKDLKYMAEVLTTMDMRLWRPTDTEVQMIMGIGFESYEAPEEEETQPDTTNSGKQPTPLKTREKKVADKTKGK